METLKIIITEKKRFLNLPINPISEMQKLYFYENSELLADLDVQIDFKNPMYIFPYDLLSFMGKEIEIFADSGLDFSFSENMPLPHTEPLKPHLFFTAPFGLINDPNGLIFYEGKYHMFFQHNPLGTTMANMHWGHAVSDDLISWQQFPEALMPDNMGDMFSGSAIVDDKNLLGFNTTEHKALVLFYTSAGNKRKISQGQEYTQCIAVSTDGGYTFKKYDKNPIIPFIKYKNRDPKVVYDESSGMYVMALYLDEGEYALFRSNNLTDWQLIQNIVIGNSTECPDLFVLYDGDKKKWVFTGADGGYLVGDFDIQNGFINVTNTSKFAFGLIYAGQSWNNLNGRVLRIDVQKARTLPTEYFNSSMTLPYEVYLKDDILRLKPAPEIEKAITPYSEINNVSLNNADFELPDYSVKIKLLISNLKKNLKIKLFGMDILIDTSKREMLLDDVVMPCYIENNKAELTIIADRICCEVFSSDRFVGGKSYIFVGNKKSIKFEGDGEIEHIEIGVY